MTRQYFTINQSTTADDLKKQRDRLLLVEKIHPDHGGDHDDFVEMERQFKLANGSINVFKVLGKADASGRQFLYDLIEGVAQLVADNQKYPKWAISVGVNTAKELVNSIDAQKWTSFLMNIINKHKK